MAPSNMAPLPPARAWALATAGVLTQLNAHDHAVLGGGPPGPATAADRLAVLTRDWGAGTREELLSTLGWLTREGHRKAFRDVSALDESAVEDDETRKKIRFAKKHRARIGSRSLLAWDAGRLATVAGWGYAAQLLSEDEAWSYILPMAQAVQRTYSSWDELGKHYLLGFEFWSGTWDGKVARAHLAMLDDAASPWRTLPWGLDLGQHGLTVPLQTVVMEAPASPPPPPTAGPPASPKSGGGKGLWIALGGVALVAVAGVGVCFALGVFGKSAPAPAPATPAIPVLTATPMAPAEPHTAPAPPHASAHPAPPHTPAPPAKKPH